MHSILAPSAAVRLNVVFTGSTLLTSMPIFFAKEIPITDTSAPVSGVATNSGEVGDSTQGEEWRKLILGD